MKKSVIIIIRVVASAMLIVSLAVLGVYLARDIHDNNIAKEIFKLKGQKTEDGEKIPDVLDEYAALYGENKDVIGWLKIDGTNIDNVVMFAPTVHEKYLRHDFYGNYSTRGCLYVDEGCDILHSDNLIIYGHHMHDGTMFGKLEDYSTKTYYLNHKYINFDTIYEKHTYEVVAAIKTEIPPVEEECFRYYRYTGENDTDMLSQYKHFIRMNKLYDTGVELQDGDKILTLSTCAYHRDNGRFIVVARQVS